MGQTFKSGYNQSLGESKMFKSSSIILSKRLFILTIGGGFIFWIISIATSLLPIAAEYRASFSNRSWAVQTVWVGSFFAGMVIACCVSYSLLRLIEKSPATKPIQKSTILSIIALAITTILIDAPRSSVGQSDSLYYFLIGILLNTPRFLFLGIAIGYLYKRLFMVASLHLVGIELSDCSLSGGEKK